MYFSGKLTSFKNSHVDAKNLNFIHYKIQLSSCLYQNPILESAATAPYILILQTGESCMIRFTPGSLY